MNNASFKGIDTAAIHGAPHRNGEQAHLTPIYATSTFTFDSAEQGMDRFTGKEPGFMYSRFGNPTTEAAQELLESLEAFGLTDEQGNQLRVKALLHASGQSAMATMFLSNVSAGDTILSSSALYGGTYEFLSGLITRFGVKTKFADLRDPGKVEDLLKNDRSIKVLHLETPSNPTMQCIDIRAVSDVAKRYGVRVTVDNTIATPYLQQPFALGADFVFHSTTKFLNGHGSAIGGVLMGKDLEFMRTRAYQTYKLLGANSNPFDAFLLAQGVKTLAIRMERHCVNALLVAQFLQNHTAVEAVHYNGLPTHPDHAVSARQMRRPGAVFSFELKKGFEFAKQFINRLAICVRAVSLGTTDTLVSHPASMSHSGMKREERIAAGITDGMIRISVGLEDADDIRNDLEQALA